MCIYLYQGNTNLDSFLSVSRVVGGGKGKMKNEGVEINQVE